jgi:four helix bundle protein
MVRSWKLKMGGRMKIQRFEDVLAWQKARGVVGIVYQISSQAGFNRDFSLRNQIRRSAISIMANIAEGYNRHSRKEFIRFLSISLGSASETKSHLYVALDQSYISEPDFQTAYESLNEVARLISGLIEYLKSERAKRHE